MFARFELAIALSFFSNAASNVKAGLLQRNRNERRPSPAHCLFASIATIRA
jgi:hypothetical protein